MTMTRPQTSPTITLRPAAAADQTTIREMVRAARLNPRRLEWQNFLVAERQMPGGPAQIVGIGQLRPHGPGVVELGSLAVVDAVQGQGVGSQLVKALLARAQGPLYLMCRGEMAPYYTRFDFVELTRPADMPPPFRYYYLLASWVLPVYHLFARERLSMSIMVHPGPTASPH